MQKRRINNSSYPLKMAKGKKKKGNQKNTPATIQKKEYIIDQLGVIKCTYKDVSDN